MARRPHVGACAKVYPGSMASSAVRSHLLRSSNRLSCENAARLYWRCAQTSGIAARDARLETAFRRKRYKAREWPLMVGPVFQDREWILPEIEGQEPRLFLRRDQFIMGGTVWKINRGGRICGLSMCAIRTAATVQDLGRTDPWCLLVPTSDL